ncbi:GNAT family N-acetyltransferase [Nocardioides ultimimeridianus]
MIDYVHAPEQHRYEIRDDDEVIGLAQYRLPDDVHVDFVHTEVDDAYGGQGLASKLVAFALADVEAQGKRIIPHCPYVAAWLTKHPGRYDDLVDWPG